MTWLDVATAGECARLMCHKCASPREYTPAYKSYGGLGPMKHRRWNQEREGLCHAEAIWVALEKQKSKS